MNLKQLRIEAGYKTQKSFAAALKIKQTRLNMWENNNSRPQTKDLRLVAETLGVSVETLLTCFEKED